MIQIALESYLRQWIAKKSIATRNYLILQEINKLTKVDLKDYNGLKKTLNVTLDPIFAAVATIFTNQDGFNYLDQLEDKMDAHYFNQIQQIQLVSCSRVSPLLYCLIKQLRQIKTEKHLSLLVT